MIHCKHIILLLFAALFSTVSIAQISHGGSPLNWDDATYLPVFEIKSMPVVDLVAAAAEDAVTDQFKDAPWRFGLERDVVYNLENSGTWTFENGDHIWRLGVDCPEAVNVSFMLSHFDLPAEASLYVYNSNRTAFLGVIYSGEQQRVGRPIIGSPRWFTYDS